MFRCFESIREIQNYRASLSDTVAFVPTMGGLHQGHLALIQKACDDNCKVIVSLFLNPMQFNDPKDLEKYPSDLKSDLEQLQAYPLEAVFLPTVKALYPDDMRFSIEERDHHQHACGRARPGHLVGVMTVVMKLLNIVRPERLYLGEKDYQQLALLRKMVSAFFMPVEVIGVPTVRDKRGLALSSRNALLSKTQLEKASQFYEILKQKQSINDTYQTLEKAGFKVDYIEDIDGQRLAAVYLESVRLIDNISLTMESVC